MSDVVKIWSDADRGPLYVVMAGSHFIVEAPEEDELDRAESVFRIFCSYEEAILYCEMAQEWYHEEKLEVRETSLSDLFSLKDDIVIAAMKEHGTPPRFDICQVKKDEWPEKVDTIWSAYSIQN